MDKSLKGNSPSIIVSLIGWALGCAWWPVDHWVDLSTGLGWVILRGALMLFWPLVVVLRLQNEVSWQNSHNWACRPKNSEAAFCKFRHQVMCWWARADVKSNTRWECIHKEMSIYDFFFKIWTTIKDFDDDLYHIGMSKVISDQSSLQPRLTSAGT